jgi:hypothetical protein
VKVSGLLSHQRIDFRLVIFVVSQALIDLRPSYAGKARNYIRHSRAGLDHCHDVMHTDSCAFDNRISRSYTRRFDNVSIARGDHGRILPVGPPKFKRTTSRTLFP